MNQVARHYMVASGMVLAAEASIKGFDRLHTERKRNPMFRACKIAHDYFPATTLYSERFELPSDFKLQHPKYDQVIQFVSNEYTVEAFHCCKGIRGLVRNTLTSHANEYTINQWGKLVWMPGDATHVLDDRSALKMVKRMIKKLQYCQR